MAFQGERPAIVWKLFDASAVPPTFRHQHYRFVPAQGKVAIDMFWGSILSDDRYGGPKGARMRQGNGRLGAAARILLAGSEYSGKVRIVSFHFVNGKEVGWGYGAPIGSLREKIREAQQ